uniref:Tf2-1-like SH3-like domain-containing protein n=1 Tax=Peronospora matthiolae TaxID=2874970 RepID=A0AAV1UDG2_9STRA
MTPSLVKTTFFLAVHTKRTAVDKDELAEEFLLTRVALVCFVQDSIADALDGQKRNADKHGRSNLLLFDEEDLVVLPTVNLPKHAVTNVGSSKLLLKYIGPFLVFRQMGNADTIELPRTTRTHPTFYVGRLRLYYQYEPVRDAENTSAVKSRDHLRVVQFQLTSLVD